MIGGHVRYWHKADIPSCAAHVCFWGQSGHRLLHCTCPLMTQSDMTSCRPAIHIHADPRLSGEGGIKRGGKPNGGSTQRRVFLRNSSSGGFGRTGGNGILPLPIMQVLVSFPGQCLHPLEARRRAGY